MQPLAPKCALAPVPRASRTTCRSASTLTLRTLALVQGFPNHLEKIIALLSTADGDAAVALLRSFKDSVSLLGPDNRDVVFAVIKVLYA